MSGPVLIAALPAAWWALRRARQRLKLSLETGLRLDPVAARRQGPVPTVLARAVFGLGRRMRGCACLAQAIALANLLRRRGHPAVVALGARRDAAAAFAAHAWVELAGQVLDPAPAQVAGFTRLTDTST